MSRLIRYLVLGVIAAVSVISLSRRRVQRSTRFETLEPRDSSGSPPTGPIGRTDGGVDPRDTSSPPVYPYGKEVVSITEQAAETASPKSSAGSSVVAPFLVLLGVVGTLGIGWLAYVPVRRPEAFGQASPTAQVEVGAGTASSPTPVPERKVAVLDALPTATPEPLPDGDVPEVVTVTDDAGDTVLADLGVASGSLPASEGYVLSFDGTADAAVVNWGSVDPLSSRDGWAFEVWLRPATLTGPQSIYVESISVGIGARVVELGIGLSDRNIVVGRRQAAASSTSRMIWTTTPLPPDISPGSWFHLETALRSGSVETWIDGRQLTGVDSQSSGPPVLDRSSVSLAGIGVVATPILTSPFGGAVDEIRFWTGTSARSDSGRSRTDRISRADPSLIGYFPISASEAAGTGVADATGRLGPLSFEGGLRWAPLASASSVGAPSDTPLELSPSQASPSSMGDGGSIGAWIVRNAFIGDVLNSGWKISGDATLSDGGWLRLTRDRPMQLGSAYLEEPLPTALGLTIDFDYAAWTEDDLGADGIVVFLADGSSPAVEVGQRAGSLGYGRYCQTGLTNAYLGVALDAFGTFASNEPTCNAGAGSRSPNSVVVRGSGNRNQGYALITNQAVRRSLVATGVGARPQFGEVGTQHVTLALSPGGILSLTISYYGSSEQVSAISQFDLSSVSGQAALPDTLRIGVAGATGGLSAIHEVSRLSVRIGE